MVRCASIDYTEVSETDGQMTDRKTIRQQIDVPGRQTLSVYLYLSGA